MSNSGDIRERILSAGLDLARDGQIGLGVDVRLPAAAQRAGVSTATAYKIWGGNPRSADGPASEKFRRDVAAHALREIRRHTFGDMDQTAQFIRSMQSPLDETIRILSEIDLNLTDAHRKDMCISYALLGAAANDETLRAVAAERYEQGQADFAKLFRTVLDSLGLKMRHPYSEDNLALALGSLADGFILRSLLDPDVAHFRIERPTGRDGKSVQWYLYGCAAEGIVLAMTEVADPATPAARSTTPRHLEASMGAPQK